MLKNRNFLEGISYLEHSEFHVNSELSLFFLDSCILLISKSIIGSKMVLYTAKYFSVFPRD